MWHIDHAASHPDSVMPRLEEGPITSDDDNGAQSWDLAVMLGYGGIVGAVVACISSEESVRNVDSTAGWSFI